ncbi:hypothetical protein HOY34_06545 [Xinfangfangia sp. D13-10-4-6]|uniref:acyl-CoA dehydrogenase family protein n=1 Tax=Pseudogemmobacter hezensis TaxID=2737662 RepID=UPI001551B529|nr:acyl-CoA dehydrogenase family protein [Pseudogemmobacter hezensis]NPD14865.1 hypothetical protein [Pseudogemmobacter hezensis]
MTQNSPPDGFTQAQHAAWIDAARAVARKLRDGIALRDRQAGVPEYEVALLKEAGLLGIFVPQHLGGGGASWSVVAGVIHEIARADSSVAHILAYHYFGARGTPPGANGSAADRHAAGVAKENLFHGTLAQAAYPPLVEARPDGKGGYLLNGAKPFTSGASVGDRLLVWAQFSQGAQYLGQDVSGHLVTFSTSIHAPGIRYAGGWDTLGQRRTASGTLVIENAAVSEADVIHQGYGVLETTPAANLDVLLMYSAFANIFTGLARGAFDEALAYVKTSARPWVETDLAAASADPHLQERFGQLWPKLLAAEALTRETSRQIDHLLARGDALTWEERGAGAVAVSAARLQAAGAALEISSKIFGLTGARSASLESGLDRFWRNARTLTLHDPLHYKELEIGRWLLTGTAPVPGFYS